MQNEKPAATSGSAQTQPVDDDPLDRPFGAPLAPIRGIDVDLEEESNTRMARAFGIKPLPGGDHADNAFERAVEYTDWRKDAAREGPYSKGDARRTYEISHRLDGFLLLPALCWFWAVLDQDWNLAVFGSAMWLLALLVWTPWILWRVSGTIPQGDTARAGGHLAIAWMLLILLIPAAFNLIALLIVLPLVYLPGLGLMYMALTVPPADPPQAPAAD